MEENKVIEFREELVIEDLQKANFYNFKRHKKYLTNQIIFAAMSLLMIGMAVTNRQWVILGIGVLLFLFSTVLFVPLYKKLIYNAVKKSFKENLQIKLLFDNEGFYYELETKTDVDYPKYEYNNVTKVYNLKNYIYMFFANSAVAIIKKEACTNIEELEKLLEEKYTNLNKYIVDDKTSL